MSRSALLRYGVLPLVLAGIFLAAASLGGQAGGGPQPSDADPSAPHTTAGPTAPVAAIPEGIEGVRWVARRTRETVEQFGDETVARGMVQGRLDRVLPQDAEARRTLLVEASGDADAEVRWIALLGGWRYGVADPRWVKVLLVRSRDEDPRVASEALEALRTLRDADDVAVRFLEEALATEGDTTLQAALLQALVRARPREPAFKPRLVQALGSEALALRRAGAFGLGRMDLSPAEEPYPHGDLLEPLTKALTDTDSDVRMYAAMAISRMEAEAEPAIPALIATLTDEVKAVSGWAATALGSIGRPALPALVRALQSGPPESLGDVVFILRRLARITDAAQHLRRALAHDDEIRRVWAASGLVQLRERDERVVGVLHAALESNDVASLFQALQALAQVGQAIAPPKERVDHLRTHADPLVREHAEALYRTLWPEPRPETPR